MSENTGNKNVSNDEIDLLDLFRRTGTTIGGWLNALGRGFLISTVFLLRRWLPLGLSIAVGIGASYLIKYTSSSYYTSDLVFRNNVASNSDMISYINRLHTFCKEDNAEALINALSITPVQEKNILDIGAYWVIDNGGDGVPDFVDYKNKHDIYDTVNLRMQDRLDIRVTIQTPQELALVKNGIISFINNDSLFQQRNRVRLRQNRELLTRLDYDILQLDSLQKVKYFEETRSRQPQGGGQMIFLQEQNTQLIYTDIYTLYTRKQALESERDLYNGIVTLLSDFSLPAVRDNGGLFYAKKIVPLFFIFTLLILILIANRNKLEETFRKY